MTAPDAPFNGHTALLMRVAAVAVPASLLLSAGAAFGGWLNSQDVRAESRARQETSCEAGNDVRATIRQMSKDASIEVGEAIIEVSSQRAKQPPDPAVIDEFRKVMQRRLDAIVNQLPARRWDPDADECVDVPVAAGG